MQLDVRELLGERAELREDPREAELVARAEDDFGDGRALVAVRRVDAVFGGVDATARVREKREAALGERDDARRALEERRAELFFELANARAERGRRERRPCARLCEN